MFVETEDPYVRLLELPSLSRAAGLSLLQDLASLPVETWLSFFDSSKVRDVEQMFYLDRKAKQTQNWWLYDSEASAYADRLLRVLALTEQTSLISALP